MVYFRVTEDEFHQFMSVCEQEGARSVSDLARNAVQRLITECTSHRETNEAAPKVQVLEKLIAQVTEQLELLSTLKENAIRRNMEGGASIVTADKQDSKDE